MNLIKRRGRCIYEQRVYPLCLTRPKVVEIEAGAYGPLWQENQIGPPSSIQPLSGRTLTRTNLMYMRHFYVTKHGQNSTPAGDTQGIGFFQTGQGGRTVLPLSSAFPTSRFPGLFFYVVFNIAKHGQNRNPARDTQGVGFFQMGQGGRTVLPPLSSAFPTSRFPGLFFHVVFNMTKHGQNRNPARDTQGVGFFQMGQGGRTVLPPLFQPHVFQVCFSTWCLT